MKRFVVDRRALMKGFLGGSLVTVGLPPLEIFLGTSRRAHASSGFPKRFGLFFWGNGNIPERWVPPTQGENYELSEQLSALEPLKSDVTVVTGMNVLTGNTLPHASGIVGLLSGAPLIPNGPDYTFRLPSVDQIIAKEIGKDTRFKSVELGVRPKTGLSHNGPNSINPAEANPARLFDRVFGGGFRAPGTTTEPDPKLRLRRSVLDAITADANRLSARLGSTDKARLDQHLTGIRELERRIARLEEDPPSLAACAVPQMPEEYPDIDGRPQLEKIADAMADIVAMTLACDQTRVFSHFFSYPVNNVLYQGATAGHHQLTHDEPGDQPQVNEIVSFIIRQYARLIERLKAVPEGDGTLLDSCAVLATSDVSFGRTHSLEDYPILIAGNACGALKSGIHYRSATGENTSKVILSLIRAMGIPAASFGEEAGRTEQGLGAIEA